jgi:hypothetical protein
MFLGMRTAGETHGGQLARRRRERNGDTVSARWMHNLRAIILRSGARHCATPGVEKCLSNWDRKEGNELRFEVNGQMFFVNFVPEEGRWYCYAPTATGMQRIPVSMDGTPFVSFDVPVDEQAKEVVN